MKDSRTSLLKKNVYASFVLKAVSALSLFLWARVSIEAIGAYENGIWLTISSVLVWIDSLDVGLANGLRNSLATHMAHNDRKAAREVVSSTFFMLWLIIIPALVLMLAATFTFDVHSVFNADATKVSHLTETVAAATILVSLTFVFKFVGNIYLGLQLPAVNNLLVTLGHLLILGGTWALYASGTGSLLNVALVYTAAPLAVYVVANVLTFGWRYAFLTPSLKAFNLGSAKQMLRLGVKFFLLQVAGILLFASSNILIAQYFSPAEVTPYQMAYRYFSLIVVLFSVVGVPYWSATTDAYERGDMAWVRQSSRTLSRIVALLGVVLALMVACSNIVYRIWLGPDLEIPLPLSAAVAGYIFVCIVSMRYSFFLNGMGLLRLQIIMTIAAAVLFIGCSYFMAASIGVVGIPLTLVLVNLPGLFINRAQLGKALGNKLTGLWAK